MAKAQARANDARFSERDNPDAKIWDQSPDPWVKEHLLEHVRNTGQPDLWKYHCHSLPAPDSPVPEIIAENIIIPERLRSTVGRAPCPLCSLHGPKYFHGMLVFYRTEKALCVIGHECARKIYGSENIDRERAACRLKQEDNSAISFLIDSFPIVKELREYIGLLIPRSRYIDDVRRKVINAITKQTAKSIYRHVSIDGLLKLYEPKSVPVFRPDGNPVTDSNGNPVVQLEDHVVGTYPLRCAQMLNNGDRLSEAALHRADKILISIDYGDEDALLDALSALGVEGRAKGWKDLRSAWDLIAEARTLCHETQEFLETKNLKNLVAWANDWRAPVHIKCGIDTAGRAWFENKRYHRRYVVILNSTDITAPLAQMPQRDI
jgi:hypothetical protein